MIEFLFISFLLAAFAIVFTEVLTAPGMILAWYAKLLDKLPEWISHPLGGCIYCFAGQISLWFYLYYFWHSYDLVMHILFITLTIFYTLIYIQIWKQND